MRKVLKNKPKTRAYLDKLPKIHMVGCWARYGVLTFPFTGKYVVRDGISIPLVYDYDDHNGTCDNYYLRRLDYTTTGSVIMWTQNEKVANRIAESLNKDTIEVKHTQVPLITVDASVAVTDDCPRMRDYVDEILAQRLGEEILKYADIQWCDNNDGPLRYDRIYRATVKVAADKRG